MASRLPLDACPFPRPFLIGFGECGVYEPAEFAAGPAEAAALLTCRHLKVGVGGVGRYYPKCGIGGAEDRRGFGRPRGTPAGTGLEGSGRHESQAVRSSRDAPRRGGNAT